MEKIYKAKKILGHWPLWLVNKVEQNIQKGIKGTDLVRKILDEDNIIIRTKNIRQRAKRIEL
jgi:hypothetical protein